MCAVLESYSPALSPLLIQPIPLSEVNLILLFWEAVNSFRVTHRGSGEGLFSGAWALNQRQHQSKRVSLLHQPLAIHRFSGEDPVLPHLMTRCQQAHSAGNHSSGLQTAIACLEVSILHHFSLSTSSFHSSCPFFPFFHDVP